MDGFFLFHESLLKTKLPDDRQQHVEAHCCFGGAPLFGARRGLCGWRSPCRAVTSVASPRTSGRRGFTRRPCRQAAARQFS